LTNPGGLRGGNRGEPFVLGLLAGLATLGLVLQSLVMKEDLLAARPDEILCAINAFDDAILEFHLCLAPLSVRIGC
jgi:hypothetical protein